MPHSQILTKNASMFIGEGVKNIHAWWIRMRRICWRCVCGYLTYVTFFRMSASSVRITGPPSRVLFTSRTPSTAEQCQGKKSVQNMFVFVNLNCRNSRLGLFNLTLKWPTFAYNTASQATVVEFYPQHRYLRFCHPLYDASVAHSLLCQITEGVLSIL